MEFIFARGIKKEFGREKVNHKKQENWFKLHHTTDISHTTEDTPSENGRNAEIKTQQ
jgi:hypothetical protein